ncbi:MAG: CsbD family protein [Synechococcales bacterium]|nr:CsbD family protein [Synechococcales bacterium]
MSTEDRMNATAKNVEGKAQEAMGNITGDPEDKAEGRAKQTKAQAEHAKEDVKDKVKEKLD